ncbi:MAG TPA: glycosyltransferase family 4 protein [Stellaceae bacterium]
MSENIRVPGRGRDGLSVCIIACKDLSLNTRVIRQARSLARAGHRVTIIGFVAPDAKLAGDEAAATLLATGGPGVPGWLMTRLWFSRRVLRDEVRVSRNAAAAVAAGKSRNGRFSRRAAARLAGCRFDVVQAHFDKALIAAEVLSRDYGAKLVFDAVEVPFDEELIPTAPTVRALRLAEIRRETEIARCADGWITINDSLADAAVDRFGIARPLVLRNCQEEGPWVSDGRLRRDLGLSAQARVLLHLNTLRRGEGIEVAIEALARLPSDVHLVGLGPVPQRGFVREMRQCAARHGVAERFHLAPLQPPHALPAYIAGADIGVIARQGTSQNMRLSLPNRLFQMIAARLPVIATPLPEIAAIVRRWGVGTLFEAFDPAALAASVQAMFEPAAQARYRSALDGAARRLTWERESEPYVRLIEDLAWGALPAAQAAEIVQ